MVVLLDVPILEQQLLGLVWRGKIDRPAGEHDDWANAAVGAIVCAAKGASVGPLGPAIMGMNATALSVTAASAAAFYGSAGGGSLEVAAFGWARHADCFATRSGTSRR